MDGRAWEQGCSQTQKEAETLTKSDNEEHVVIIGLYVVAGVAVMGFFTMYGMLRRSTKEYSELLKHQHEQDLKAQRELSIILSQKSPIDIAQLQELFADDGKPERETPEDKEREQLAEDYAMVGKIPR